jgi:membrane-associated phospholipid phosphatase
VAASLVLLHFLPVVGLVFLFVSIWIALGAVIGRYHYALDVLLGAATALGAFAACYPHL